MKIKTNELEDRQMEVIVEIDPKLADTEKRKAARRIAKKIQVPGFRPGKAPYQVIVRRVGEAALLDEALDHIVETVYPKMIEEADLDPIDSGKIIKVDVDPLKLTFKVPLRPDIDLGSYRDIRTDYEAPESDDEELEDTLEWMRNNKAVVEEADHPVELGDLVTFDVEGIIRRPSPEVEEDVEDDDDTGEEAAEDDEGDDDTGEEAAEDVDDEDDDYKPVMLIDEQDTEILIEESMDWPVPDFAEHVIGMQVDETREISTSFPDDYEDEAMAGSTVKLEVTCKLIKTRTLPEWTDAFAQTLGEYDSLLDLRMKVRQDLLDHATSHADQDYSDLVLDKLVAGTSFVYPPVMLEREIDGMLNNMKAQLQQQKLSLEDYTKLTGRTEEAIRDDFKEGATKQLERSLAISQLIDTINIEVTEEDIDAKVEETVAQFDGDETKTQIREMYDNPQMRQNLLLNLLSEKAVVHIVAIAKGEEPEIAEAKADKEAPDPSKPTEATEDDKPDTGEAAVAGADEAPAATAADTGSDVVEGAAAADPE